MRFVTRLTHANKAVNVYLPVKEKKLQMICDDLGLVNNMQAKVVVDELASDARLEKLFKDNEYGLNEFNFLMRRLDSLNEAELTTFCAVAVAQKLTDATALINLSYNTHCYSLLADFSDLNTLGKSLFLNENISLATKDYLDFDGQAYIEKMIAANPNPLLSPYGFVYPNQNQPEEMYNGRNFPDYVYKDSPITLELSSNDESEYLYLPCEPSEVNKALERLSAASLEDCTVQVQNHELPGDIAYIIFKDEVNFEHYNNLARQFDEVGSKEYHQLSKLASFIKITSSNQLSTLLNCVQEFELYPRIHNPEQYGRYMITESGRFEYDENLEEYIDFERYGAERVAREEGVFTDKGYLNYIGYNQEMAQILNQNLGMNLSFEDYSETIRLYMPLEVTSYYDEDDYGRYYQSEYETELASHELCGYEDKLNDFIMRHQPEIKSGRGLMEYYGNADSINAKVQSYHFEFEELGGEVFGSAVIKLNAPLNDLELENLKEIITGQSSDGIGEHIEQQDFMVDGRAVNIHLWSSGGDWVIKTAEEMGFSEQSPSFGLNMT